MSLKDLLILCTLSALLCGPFSANAVRQRRSSSLPPSPKDRRHVNSEGDAPRALQMQDASQRHAMYRQEDIECGGVCCCCPSAECCIGATCSFVVLAMAYCMTTVFQGESEAK